MRFFLQSAAVAFFVITIIVIIRLYYPLADNTKGSAVVIPLTAVGQCNLLQSNCIFTAGNEKIEIKFSGDVRTMQTFKLLAKLNNFDETITDVVVDFSMQSMKMGFNYFRLAQNKSADITGYWQTSILLPVCVSKQTDWLMQFVVKTENRTYKVAIPLTIK